MGPPLVMRRRPDRAGRGAAAPSGRAALRARLEALGAPRREVPARQPFMLATLVDRPFSRPGWMFELKYDGVRVLARRRGAEVSLESRSGQEVAARYPEIAAALGRLAADDFVLDGEIVALDEAGRPSFQRLQPRMHLGRPEDVRRAAARQPVSAIFFDCLALEGRDLRALPLEARQEALRRAIPDAGTLGVGANVAERGRELYDLACEQGLEGIVAKRAGSPYRGGRSRDWLKIKCARRQEFVVGGYTDPQGTRPLFGALHVGLYDGPRLVYVSKVGTGFDRVLLRAVWARLQPIRRRTSPFDAGAPAGRGHHWVEPRLVCEIRFAEWTREGGLRHPTFVGLRDDKRPEDCRREAAAPVPRRAPAGAVRAGAVRAGTPPPASPAAVPVTNAAKVFWPAEGYTKGDLVAYYEAVARHILPYLRDRPVVLTRYPDGIGGKSFFQKDAPEGTPEWVRTERIRSRGSDRDIDFLVIDDAAALRYVANLGTIPLHLWSARAGSLERPDWLVLDLDPKGAPFADVVEVARVLHAILEDLGLPGPVKTSGATGLHVLVPLGARYTHEQARGFARLLAQLVVQDAPGIATLSRPLGARGGKVYVDWGQNGHGQTIAGPFSVRPLPGAPVSCPLAWAEVTGRLAPGRYTIRTVPGRFARRPDPLLRVLGPGIDMASAIAAIERRLGGARRPRAPGG
jgi:bifunctional non-homologous end joining protein LigD